MNAIVDSGFLVGLFGEPRLRSWVDGWMQKVTEPVLTTAAHLAEAGHILGNHLLVMRLVKDGDVKVELDFQKEAESLYALLGKYPQMDLADAAIVRLSELFPRHTVLTVDRRDFTIYRRFGREAIPCDFPPL